MKDLKDFINESMKFNEVEVSDVDIETYLNEHNLSTEIFNVTKSGEDINYGEDIMGYLTEMSEIVIDQIGEQEKAVLEQFDINSDEVLCFKHTVNEDDASETISYCKKPND